MNASREAEIREIVLQKLAELEEQDRLGRDGQAVVELDQQAVGRLSRMDALQSQAMAKATQAQRDIQIKALKSALLRLDEDDTAIVRTAAKTSRTRGWRLTRRYSSLWHAPGSRSLPSG